MTNHIIQNKQKNKQFILFGILFSKFKNIMMKFKMPLLSFQTGIIKVKNAIDPLIKFAVYFCIPFILSCLIIGVIYNQKTLLFTGIIIGGVIVVFFIFQHIYYTLKDPDRLQSEEYQLKKLEIEKETKRGICIPLEEQILESPKSDELIEEKSLGEEDKE